MNSMKNRNIDIVMIGAGNVAFNLSRRLLETGYKIVQVVGHSSNNTKDIAAFAGCEYTLRIEEIYPKAHLYIVAVPDGAIADVVKSLPVFNGIIVHTSGSTPMGIFKNKTSNFGVFYPFQTFSKERRVSFVDIPICIEASNEEVHKALSDIAESIGSKPIEMDAETRKWLHLSGVFSCNFVNHMLAIGQLIAEENDFDYGLLKPLVLETVQKAMELGPLASQTGPAIRGDSDTIKMHVAMLSTVSDDLRELYMSLSSSIWQLEHGEE